VYWDAAIETLPPAGLRDLQLNRLRGTLRRAALSPFYRERLAQAGIHAGKPAIPGRYKENPPHHQR
jgi:phenylacetate-coenzyme A ligase PaaK-like adenylate-forming protein